jgi:hypothetical protein
MATVAEPIAEPQGEAQFFARYTLVLAVFILLAFIQFAVRGYSAYVFDYVWPHVHGGLMVAWLAVMVMQTRLVAQGDIARHRKLGWIGAYLVVAEVASGCMAGVMALKAHVVPPFFSNAYFLALTLVSPVVFGGLVFAAITRRKQTDYHRRLMFGSLVAITEPAFGRVLPMPLMIGWGEWLVLGIQLAMLGVVALHDRKTIGRIHPATATAGAIIAMTHVLVELSATNPDIIAFADRMAG